jgi:hypothetical protein
MNDTDLLPPELAKKSLSPLEIVLPYVEVLEAIEHLAAKGYLVFAWEGWLKYPDGRHTHSIHQGTRGFWGTKGQSAQERIQETATFARQTIKESQQEWDEKPEIAGGTLCFCLSIEAV